MKLIELLSMGLVVATVCSCEDNLTEVLKTNTITPRVSAMGVSTRSHDTGGEFCGRISLGDVYGEDVYLDSYVEDYNCMTSIPSTRGTILTTGNIGSNIDAFMMSAYYLGINNKGKTTAINPFTNANVNRNGSGWKLSYLDKQRVEQFYPWVDDTDYKFWSWYCPSVTPALANDFSSMTISNFTAAGSQDGSDDAKALKDVIVAYNQQQKTDNNGYVEIQFYHALAAVRLDITDVADDIEIVDMALDGLVSKGTCTVTPASVSQTAGVLNFSWALSNRTDDVATYVQTFDPEDFHEETVSGNDRSAVYKIDGDKIFFIIPQTLTTNTKLGITFKKDESILYKEVSLAPAGSSVNWNAGKLYTYRVSMSELLETANCHIISEEGNFAIPAFCMGNRQECRLYEEGQEEVLGLQARVLWADTGMTDNTTVTDAISNVRFVPGEDGRGKIAFHLNKDASTGKPYRGNVVVCLVDGDDNILWSWHLWLTEEPETVYTGGFCAEGTYTTSGYEFVANSANSGNLAIMDRNLGAISADPADGWKTYGLYYQMGRKDPFIGGCHEGDYTTRSPLTAMIGDEQLQNVHEWESSPFNTLEFTDETTWCAALSNGWVYQQSKINLTESIRHPMTFSTIYTAQDVRWTLSTDADNQSYMTDSIYGNTGLIDEGHEAYWNRTKTAFDPCPAGWTVLGERDAYFWGRNDTFSVSNSTPSFGVTSHFTYDGTEYHVWWPAAGVRTTNGTMAEVGYRGAYFHYDHINHYHGAHGSSFYLNNKGGYSFDFGGPSSGNGSVLSNHALSIRCVRAQQNTTSVGKKRK